MQLRQLFDCIRRLGKSAVLEKESRPITHLCPIGGTRPSYRCENRELSVLLSRMNMPPRPLPRYRDKIRKPS